MWRILGGDKMKEEKVTLIVCPYCGRVKRFGEFEYILIATSIFFHHLAQKRVKQININYEVCSFCKQSYHCQT
jgi:hypothetical protein